MKIKKSELARMIKEAIEDMQSTTIPSVEESNNFKLSEAFDEMKDDDDDSLLFDQYEEDLGFHPAFRGIERAIEHAMDTVGEEKVLLFLRSFVDNY